MAAGAFGGSHVDVNVRFRPKADIHSVAVAKGGLTLLSRTLAPAFVLLLTSCATTSGINIDFETTSARLYVEAPDGSFVSPFSGQIVDVDGIGLGREAIRLSPGLHVIRRSCPTLPAGILAAADWAPVVEYRFEAGRKYALRCGEGGLAIVPLER